MLLLGMPVPYFGTFPRFSPCKPRSAVPQRLPHPGVICPARGAGAGARGLWAAGLGPGPKPVLAKAWTAWGAGRWWHGSCCHLMALAINMQEGESPAAPCTAAGVGAIR